jgi:hypothetical protein
MLIKSVGWISLPQPNVSVLLGFTFVQPNLQINKLKTLFTTRLRK